MKRRTVLKAMAAFAMAPIVQLRREIPDERLILSFCGDDAYRYDLANPFADGSLTYATDNYAMIRAELPSRLEIGERKLPPAAKAFNDYWQPTGQWIPLNHETAMPTKHREGISCPACGDRRITLAEYPTEEELNSNSMFSRYGYDVDENSIRDKSCPVCNGLDYEGKNVTTLFGVDHATAKLRRIMALPNVMVCLSNHSVGDKNGVLLFRADGFEGVSMGLAAE